MRKYYATAVIDLNNAKITILCDVKHGTLEEGKKCYETMPDVSNRALKEICDKGGYSVGVFYIEEYVEETTQ